MEVLPFDYLDAARFFPEYSMEEKLIAYGILGGIPRYLNAFAPDRSIQENLETEVLRNGAFLYDEPMMLLRMELREPHVYNSILEAIARGYNKVTEIADCIHEDKSKCSKYLTTLLAIRLVEKQVPCGEPEGSKKTIYALTDHFYRFWYHFLFPNKSYYDLLGSVDAAKEIIEELPDFMGAAFEDVCKQYLIRQAKCRNLPFVPAYIGKWWGNNPAIRAQDDVDILALNKNKTEGIFCECKFRNHPMPMEEYEDLLTAAKAFPESMKKHFMFISKSGYTAPVQCAYQNGIIDEHLVENGCFYPEKAVTLEEFLSFAINGYKSRKDLPPERPCAYDEVCSPYAVPYVRAACALGLLAQGEEQPRQSSAASCAVHDKDASHLDSTDGYEDLHRVITRGEAAELCRRMKV